MAKTIHCLGIATSPRYGGNTSTLMEKALAGAAEGGATTELININRFKISPCLGCNGCYDKGSCVVNDDMQLIYPKLLAADRIILTAPIFSMGICAQAKTLIDRTQRFWATKYILKRDVIENKDQRPPRKGMFISVAGSNHKDMFMGALQTARYFFLMLEAEFAGSYCYPKIDEKGEILDHPVALEEVYKAGMNLVQR